MKKLLVIVLLTGCVLALLTTLHALAPLQHVHHGTERAGTIKGLVLNPEGQPVSQATVFAERENFLKGLMRFAKTDEQGRFVITGLEPRAYKVYASKEEAGYPLPISAFHTGGSVLIQQVDVYEGQVTSDVVIHLAPKAAELAGHVTNAATKGRIDRAQITLRRADNPNYYYVTGLKWPGTFKVLVPTEPFTIEVSAPGYEKKHLSPLQLKQGEVKRLNISLRPVK